MRERETARETEKRESSTTSSGPAAFPRGPAVPFFGAALSVTARREVGPGGERKVLTLSFLKTFPDFLELGGETPFL